MTPSPLSSDRSALAIATLAIFILTVMDAMVKGLGARYDAFEIMLFRQGFGLLFTGAIFLVLKPGWPTFSQLRTHGLRVAIMMSSGLLFFHALGKMPLAELFIYTFTAPMFVAVFSAMILKERLTTPVVLGVATGFSGILLLMLTDPKASFTGGDWDGRAAAIISPITYAFAMVMLRRQAGQEPAARITLMQSLITVAIIAPLTVWRMPLPEAHDLWRGLAIGGLGTLGTYLLTMAYARTEAAKVAVTEYTGLIWAAMIGYAFFGEAPRAMVYAGGALVILGCVIVARGERLRQPAAA
jgi:drug/metabolite transporter (DMT)-like permease